MEKEKWWGRKEGRKVQSREGREGERKLRGPERATRKRGQAPARREEQSWLALLPAKSPLFEVEVFQ